MDTLSWVLCISCPLWGGAGMAGDACFRSREWGGEQSYSGRWAHHLDQKVFLSLPKRLAIHVLWLCLN